MSNNTSGDKYNFITDNFNDKIGGLKELLSERIKNLEERIKKLEDKEFRRDDRKWNIKMIIFSAFFGAALVKLIEYIIQIINKY